MIVYFDASAIVPLYARDRLTTVATRTRRSATHVATSLLSYAEVLATLRRLRDDGSLTAAAHRLAASAFLSDWPHFGRVPVRARLLGEVRRVLEAHPLKGADAVHLATALYVRRGLLAGGLESRFACDDRALAKAAMAEGLAPAW